MAWFNFAPRKSSNPIGSLYSRNKDEWIKRFFPEYATLFGGYPKPIPLYYYDPFNPPRRKVSTTTSADERNPWSGWPRDDIYGITPVGTRYVDSESQWIPVQRVVVPEEEYIAWCDQRNYFRNGGLTPNGSPGLDPSVLIEAFAVTLRGSPSGYLNRFKADGLKTNFWHIVCAGGRYFPDAGPSSQNPWGRNAMYYKDGHKEPKYVQDKWGPERKPDLYMAKKYHQGPIPTQAEYDAARRVTWF